jgi:hypothetical protein
LIGARRCRHWFIDLFSADQSLPFLRYMTKLESLTLQSVESEGDCVEAARLTKLTSLSLTFNWRSGNLSQTREILSPLTNLETLYINVSAASLDLLWKSCLHLFFFGHLFRFAPRSSVLTISHFNSQAAKDAHVDLIPVSLAQNLRFLMFTAEEIRGLNDDVMFPFTNLTMLIIRWVSLLLLFFLSRYSNLNVVQTN